MQYLALLNGPGELVALPGSPGAAAQSEAYTVFGEKYGSSLLGGDALHPEATTVRHGDGAPLVTDGPYAETVEAVGGFYVIEVATLDDAIELAKELPAATTGWVAVRPVEGWYPAEGDPEVTGERFMAIMYGKESPADTPGTPEWEASAGEHGRFMAEAAPAVVGGVALHPVDTTTTVRVRDGEVVVTDGPFAESAEVTGGAYVIQAADRRRGGGPRRGASRSTPGAPSRSARSWRSADAGPGRRRGRAGLPGGVRAGARDARPAPR